MPDLLQVDSQSARAILMRHPNLPYRTLTLFSKNETALETLLLAKEKLARPKQAQEHFDKLVGDVRASRHQCLQDFSLLKTIDEVREVCEDDKMRKKAIKDAEVARLRAWEDRKARGPPSSNCRGIPDVSRAQTTKGCGLGPLKSSSNIVA